MPKKQKQPRTLPMDRQYLEDHLLLSKNLLIAELTQAWLRLIGDGIWAIGVLFTDKGAELHFAVPDLTEVEAEDIADIVFELEALQVDGSYSIEPLVHEGAVAFSRELLRGQSHWHWVYWKKPPPGMAPVWVDETTDPTRLGPV